MANEITTTQLAQEQIDQRLRRERVFSDSLWGAGVGSAVGGIVGVVLGNGSGGAKFGALIGAVAPHFSTRARNLARSAEQRVGETLCGASTTQHG